MRGLEFEPSALPLGNEVLATGPGSPTEPLPEPLPYECPSKLEIIGDVETDYLGGEETLGSPSIPPNILSGDELNRWLSVANVLNTGPGGDIWSFGRKTSPSPSYLDPDI